MNEEKYTIKQIVDAIMVASDDVLAAIDFGDWGMLEDVLKDFVK